MKITMAVTARGPLSHINGVAIKVAYSVAALPVVSRYLDVSSSPCAYP